MAKAKEAPTGVKVISILYYIGSGFLALIGLLMVLGAGFISRILGAMPMLAAIGSGLFVVVGIVILAFSIIGFLVGMNLWKGKSWARIVAIILAALGVLGSLNNLAHGAFGGIIMLAIDGFIVYYLGFHKESKAFFSN